MCSCTHKPKIEKKNCEYILFIAGMPTVLIKHQAHFNNLYFIDDNDIKQKEIFSSSHKFLQCTVWTLDWLSLSNFMKHCSRKNSTAKRSVSYCLSISLQTLVAECLKMLTGMNMFNVSSFYSVLFTRSVINFDRNMGIESRRVKRDARGYTNEANKMKNERASEQNAHDGAHKRISRQHRIQTPFDNWIEQLEQINISCSNLCI